MKYASIEEFLARERDLPNIYSNRCLQGAINELDLRQTYLLEKNKLKHQRRFVER